MFPFGIFPYNMMNPWAGIPGSSPTTFDPMAMYSEWLKISMQTNPMFYGYNWWVENVLSKMMLPGKGYY